MKKSIKAALLSALVFPGSGHFMLKQRTRGFILCVISVAGVGFLMNHAMQQAMSTIDSLQSGLLAGGNTQDVMQLLNSAGHEDSDSITVKLITWLVGGCWLFGIVDAYRLGKKVDNLK